MAGGSAAPADGGEGWRPAEPPPAGDLAAFVRPLPTAAQLRPDLGWALLLFALSVLSSVLTAQVAGPDYGAPFPVSVALLALLTLPLAVGRRYPLAVAASTAVVFVVTRLVVVPEQLMSLVTLFISLYLAGAWSNHRRAALAVRIAIVVALVGIALVAFLPVLRQPQLLEPLLRAEFGRLPVLTDGGNAAFLVLNLLRVLVYFGAAFVFGEASRRRAYEHFVQERSARQLMLTRARAAGQERALERVAISRDLHDIVAHHVSIMGVQAGAVRRIIASDPDRAVAGLRDIEQASREAVRELSLLLSALRAADVEGDYAEASATTHGIDQLEVLAGESRAAGVEVDLAVTTHADAGPGAVDALHPAVANTIYRIVQEALSNVRRHVGPGARAVVRVELDAEGAAVSVVNDNPSGVDPPRQPGGGGHGLTGIRERAEQLGGTASIGPRPQGGFSVAARLPRMPGARPSP